MLSIGILRREPGSQRAIVSQCGFDAQRSVFTDGVIDIADPRGGRELRAGIVQE